MSHGCSSCRPRQGSGVNTTLAWKHALTAAEMGGRVWIAYRGTGVPALYVTVPVRRRSTGLRECQWNGPSWPFQTSEALTGMANLLDDYTGTNRGDG